MTEIIPGIHQLRLAIPNNPLGYTNIYLVGGDGKYLLIDAGIDSGETLASLKKQLAELGIDLSSISQIIVTHAHHDHYGLADKIRQLSGAKIALHQLESNLLDSRHRNGRQLSQQMERWLENNGVPINEPFVSGTAPPGIPRFMTPPMPDITLQGGETISAGVFSLQVIWTPGHAPGHICLYEPNQKILFSGDHILPVITPNISLQPQLGGNPLGDFLNSLNSLKQLDVTTVLPAHEHHFSGLARRIEEIIQHHRQRSADILKTIETEPKTAYQISGEITWMLDFGGVSFQDLAPWDRRMAVGETLAHLEWMRIEGRVSKIHKDSLIYYRHN